MKLGSQEYKTLLRKLHELESHAIPTLAQEVEMAHIRTRLTAADMQGGAGGEAVRAMKRELIQNLVDDYAQVKAMGDLGGTELI